MDTGPRIFKCGDLIILLRPFFALFYFGFIFHAVDQNRGDLLRVRVLFCYGLVLCRVLIVASVDVNRCCRYLDSFSF